MNRTEGVKVEATVIYDGPDKERENCEVTLAIERWPDVTNIAIYGHVDVGTDTTNFDKMMAALGYVRAAKPARARRSK